MNKNKTIKMIVVVFILVLTLLSFAPLVQAGCFGMTEPGKNISNIELNSPAQNYTTGLLAEDVDFNFKWFEATGQLEDTPCNVYFDSGSPMFPGDPGLHSSATLTVANMRSGVIVPPDGEGKYAWAIACCDNSSGSDTPLYSSWRNITFDYSAPVTTLHTPNTNEVFGTGQTIDFNFTAQDTLDEGPFTCTLYVDGNPEGSANNFMNTTLGTLQGTGYSGGDHSWYVNCSDQYSNAAASGVDTFIIDTVAPVITLHEPQSNAKFAAGSLVSYNFTAVENLDTENLTCSLFVNNTVQSTASDVQNNTPYQLTASMSPGTFNWFVNCSDHYGNLGMSNSRSITYDSTGPTISLFSPAENYIEENNNTLDFNFSFDDNYSAGSFTCNLVIDDLVKDNGNVVNGTNGSLSATFTEDGNYLWYINCTDPYGNAGSSLTRTLTIDIAPVAPRLWNLLSVVGNSFIQLIGYIDKYGHIFATAQNDDHLISNSNQTTTQGFPNETSYLGSFPISAVSSGFFTISDPTNNFENLSVGKYVRLSGHNKTEYTYYQINYIDSSTIYTRKINLTPPLEEPVNVGETMYLYDRAVPTGWFNFSLELFPGQNNLTIWGSHLGINGNLTITTVYYDSVGPLFNLSTVPNITNLQRSLNFTVSDDSAVDLQTVYINASNSTNYTTYLNSGGVSYNTTNWTVANETINCTSSGTSEYSCTVHPSLEDGNYTLNFIASDTTNHTNQTLFPIIIKTLVDPVNRIWHVNNQSTTLLLQLEVYWNSSPDSFLDYYELSVSSLPIDNGGTDDIITWFPINKTLTGYTITNDTLAYGNIYYVNIRPVDLAGNKGDAASTELIYTLDPSPPVEHSVEILPDKGNWIRTNSSMNLEWNFTDNETGVAVYEYAIGTTPVSDPEHWDDLVAKTTINANTTNFPLLLSTLNLDEGQDYYLSVRAKNAYPYSSLWSSWFSSPAVTLDSLEPSGGWLAYETGNVVVSQLNFSYAIGNDTGMGEYNVSGIEYATLKKKTATLYDNVCGSYTDWEIINASMYLGNPATYNYNLESGNCYRFALDVYDFAGNVKTYEYTQIRNTSVDLTAPSTVSINNTPTIIYDTTLSFDWSDATDPESGILGYQCALGTALSGPDISNTVSWFNCSNSSSATLSGLDLDNAEIYYFSVRAENNYGLVGNVSTSYGMLYFDIYPPAPLSVLAVANDTNGSDGWLDSNTTTTSLVVQLKGESALDCVWSYYDVGYVTGVSYTTDCLAWPTNTSKYNCTLSGLTEGNYDVHVACQDTNGNEQNENQNLDFTFTKDVAAPNITILVPEQDGVVLPAELTDFTVRITDASSIAYANYTIKTLLTGELQESGALTNDGNDTYSVNVNLTSYGGENVFTVFSEDSLNRTSNKTHSFLVNLDQPYVDLIINDSQGNSQRYLESAYNMYENVTLLFTTYFYNSFLYAITNATGQIVANYSLVNSSTEMQNKTSFVVSLNISDFDTDTYTLVFTAQGGLTNSTFNRTITLTVDGEGPVLVADSLERNPVGFIYEDNDIQFKSSWEDQNDLADIILSHNASGNWTNISATQTAPREWRPDEQRYLATLSSQYLETGMDFSYKWYAYDSIGSMNQTVVYPLHITNRPASILTDNLTVGLAGQAYLQVIQFEDQDTSQTEFNCSMNLIQPGLNISFVNNTKTCLLDWTSAIAGTYPIIITVQDLKNGTVLGTVSKSYTLQIEDNTSYAVTTDINNYPTVIDFSSSSAYIPDPLLVTDGIFDVSLPVATNYDVSFEREGLRVTALNISLAKPLTYFFRKNYTSIYDGGQLLGLGLRYNPLLVYATSVEFSPSYQQVWNHTNGGNVYSSPQEANGLLFVGSTDSTIYALNESNGTVIWSYDTGAAIKSTALVDASTLYIGNTVGTVFALNISTGVPLWNYSIGGGITSQAKIMNSYLLFSSTNARVYALNKSDGSQIWNYTSGGPISSSPEIVNGKVYIGSNDNNMYALNLTSGIQLWNYTSGGAIVSSPLEEDGELFFGSGDFHVYALDALTGVQVWNYSTGGPVQSSAQSSGNNIVIGSDDNSLYALRKSDGTLQWSYATGDDIVATPEVADGLVFVGSLDNTLYALLETNGSSEWSYTTGDNILTKALLVNDKLYFTSADTKLYAFEKQTNAKNFTVSLNYSYAGVSDADAQNLKLFKYSYDEPTETIDYSATDPEYGMQNPIIDTATHTVTLTVNSFSAFIMAMDTQPPSCSDGIQNQNEEGVDCGGVCDACVVEGTSPHHGSGGGSFGGHAPEANCNDGLQNQNEVAVDCGGVCGPCAVSETCFDGLQNQDELAVDCGGVCGPCAVSESCFDGIKNQDELAVDCGGVCEKSCALTTDLESNTQVSDLDKKPTKPVEIQRPESVTQEKSGMPSLLWLFFGVIIFGLLAFAYLKRDSLFSKTKTVQAFDDQRSFDKEIVAVAKYVARQKDLGFEEPTISSHLINNGYAKPLVDTAIEALSQPQHREAIVNYFAKYTPLGFELGELHSWLLGHGIDKGLLALAVHDFEQGESPLFYSEGEQMTNQAPMEEFSLPPKH